MRWLGLMLAGVLLIGCSSDQPAVDAPVDTSNPAVDAALTAPSETAAVQAELPPEPREASFRVGATLKWQDAGVVVAAGESIVFHAPGRYSFRPGTSIDANGLADKPEARPASGKWPANALPGLALIGRVGADGNPFLVGAASVHKAEAAGTLYLMVNDDVLKINWGHLDVQIRPKPRGRCI
jgi:hypothetical protein